MMLFKQYRSVDKKSKPPVANRASRWPILLVPEYTYIDTIRMKQVTINHSGQMIVFFQVEFTKRIHILFGQRPIPFFR